MSDTSFGLNPDDFEPLGEFAAAGLRSTRLALERAACSFSEKRIPIAGAAVYCAEDGTLTEIAVGNNCRIPPSSEKAFGYPGGYPSDHGETAAIRQIDDVSAWDWSRVVFATTLSPCIMCARTLSYLHQLGLNKIVVAEAQTFAGESEMLRGLDGMTLVGLTNPDGVRMMRAFARTYPWDWAADIGKVPPDDLRFARSLASDAGTRAKLLAAAVGDPAGAALVDANGEVRAKATDRRAAHGGNPAYSAPMIAIGEATSDVNLRESVLVFATRDTDGLIDIDVFGHASLGACELFRPAAVLSNAPFERTLSDHLEAADVKVIEPV